MKKIVLIFIILSFTSQTFAKKKMSAAKAQQIGTQMGEEQNAKANADNTLQTSDLTSVNDQANKSSGGNKTGALIATVAGAVLIVKG
nr:hypothetical protein [Pseudobdellovibrionaceae bacterium]